MTTAEIKYQELKKRFSELYYQYQNGGKVCDADLDKAMEKLCAAKTEMLAAKFSAK